MATLLAFIVPGKGILEVHNAVETVVKIKQH
jgi:hypothetical protein